MININGNEKFFNDLSGKELINIHDGVRLGRILDCDLYIDRNGRIEYLLIPDFKSPFKLFRERKMIKIPWSKIKNIGNDLIVVEISNYEYL